MSWRGAAGRLPTDWRRMDEAGAGRILSNSHGPTTPVARLARTTGRRSSARVFWSRRRKEGSRMEPTRQQARVDSIAFELRTTLSMCKNNLCGVRDLQPLLERMVGTSKDHYLGKACMMLDLAF